MSNEMITRMVEAMNAAVERWEPGIGQKLPEAVAKAGLAAAREPIVAAVRTNGLLGLQDAIDEALR